MDKYIELANKLNFIQKENILTRDYFLNTSTYTDIYYFFKFLQNSEFVQKINEIYEQFLMFDKKKIFVEIKEDSKFQFNNSDKCLLLSIFIFKAITKTTITPGTCDIKYINSDQVINNITQYYNKFLVFYFFVEIENPILFKKIIFKFLTTLVILKVIKEKIIRVSKKTLKEWSFEFKTIILSSEEYLNISNEPFEILIINNTYYLKGSFFIKIYKIFEENLRSNCKFQFKTDDYLYNITKAKYYLNKKDLNDVIAIIEKKENINLELIEKEILNLNDILKNNFFEIKIENQKLKEKYFFSIKNFLQEEYLNFSYEINKKYEFCLFLIRKFCYKILALKNLNLNESHAYHFDLLLKQLLIDYITKTRKIKKQHQFAAVKSIKFINEEDADETSDTKVNEWNNAIDETNNKFETSEDELFNDYTDLSDNEENLKKELNYSEDLNFLVKFVSNEELKKLLIKNKFRFETLEQTPKLFKIDFIELDDFSTVYYLGARFYNVNLWQDYYNEKKKNITKYIEENKLCCSRISKLLIYYNLYLLRNTNFDENLPIYFPFFFDFRGRFYYYSSVSPTNLKFTRYIFTYGFYSKEQIDSCVVNRISPLIEIHRDLIAIIKNKYQINSNSFKINEAIFWILISVGKIKLDKNRIQISTREMLESGLKILENEPELDLLETIEFTHYKKILFSLNLEKIPARGILKDATASFIQNLIRLMGYKNEDSLKYANLNSEECWYDTYSFILKKWLEKESTNFNSKYLTLFTRKTIKKSVMTNPYSATYLTAFNYFKEAVKKYNDIDINFGSEEEIIFKNFYNFISNDVENKFFLKHKSNLIVSYIKAVLKKNSKEILLETHDSQTNIIYYKLISKNFDLIITIPSKKIKKRVTKKYQEIDEFQIDYDKIARSIRANWVHYIDALLLRDINRSSKYIYITIHDCFIVDFLSVSDFIITANEQSNIKIFESFKWNKDNELKFFSIFIFI